MPITIPDRNGLRLTTGGTMADNAHFIPCVAAVPLVNPGPVRVDATSPASSGNALVSPAVGAAGRTRYLGFNFLGNVAKGQRPSVVRGPVIIEGFAGMTPGDPVYVADDAVPDPVADFSGLTHTAPAGATNADVVAIAISATKLEIVK